jgi:hypothetical protein
VCEQLLAGLQTLTKQEFMNAIGKQALTLGNLQDPGTAFFMLMNSITKQAKHSHGCFNNESSRHDVPVARCVNDNTTKIGSMSLRYRA